MPTDARTGPLRSQAAADYVNQTIAKWAAGRGEPVTVTELARLLSAETGRTVQGYEVRRALHGETRFENLAYRQAWAAVVPGLDGERLARLAHTDLTAEPIEVAQATPSDRWATRGPQDRSRSEAFSAMLRDAVSKWERLRRAEILAEAQASGRKLTAKELDKRAAVSTVMLAGAVAAAWGKPYHHKQAGRALEGDVAGFDDPAQIRAWLQAVPTLDRAEVLAWWVGELLEEVEQGRLASILSGDRRRSDQRKPDKRHYAVSAA